MGWRLAPCILRVAVDGAVDQLVDLVEEEVLQWHDPVRPLRFD